MMGAGQYDYLIDATDSVKAKAAMLAWARRHDMPVITIGSAGGKTDAAQISVRDLAKTEQEPLLKKCARSCAPSTASRAAKRPSSTSTPCFRPNR
jgi:tRNA A37 threonylcarbamoyladenosine dehydratase